MSTSAATTGHAAIVGGGVIGGGWAARFLLCGWDVRVFDPHPDAKRKINDVVNNARICLPQLSDVALPPEGRLIFCTDLSAAVTGARWIQESVPEQLQLKRSVLKQIQTSAAPDAIIASSTSGFKPSELRLDTGRLPQPVVAHPFNPVYLLPLVELVGGPEGDPALIARAHDILLSLGMKPLIVRQEIDAHLADRFLEAVWREALWLIKDDIATTEEIDDAIRFGFGLRWAQMGLFETYRLGGGEEGMAHFIRQFGPALKWPWTKLMDVPELDETLINKIASQSDQQSGAHSIRELERIRDQNLVGILRSLKDRRWGAGALLHQHDLALSVARGPAPAADAPAAEPMKMLEFSVLPSWIDYNGHMTEFRYLQVFADSSDHLLRMLGVAGDYLARVGSYYTVETHIMHVGESKVEEALYSTMQILHADKKRMHVFQRLFAGNHHRLVATGEQMLLHVATDTADSGTSRVSEASDAVWSKLESIATAHAALPWPEVAGRRVGQKRNKG